MSPTTVPMKSLPALRSVVAAAAIGALFLSAVHAAEKKKSSSSARFPAENRAVIVVTGLRLDEAAVPSVKDLAIGEGAVVRVTATGGKAEEKIARVFPGRSEKAGGGTFFTADFGVELDATYEVTMTFRDGTTIRVYDFRLPANWKTHFYFHSTRGTLSTASILRVGTDPTSKLRCHIYAVFPVAAYRALGGQQVE